MAAHDSGVDTSNDSFCTNENSNNTSINSPDACSSSSSSSSSTVNLQNFWHRTLAESIEQQHYELSPLYLLSHAATYPECSTSRSFKSPGERSSLKIGSRYQHHHTTRHALVPYVCKLPNERKLRLAASVSNVELLERLLDNGVNPDACDEHHRSPLHLASSRGYKDVVKVLLTRGANPNKQDSLGNTPLHLAVCSASSYNFNMVVRILLQAGASVSILDKSGKTPLDLARSKLLLMRRRLGLGTGPESARLFIEMSMLTGLLHKTLSQQRQVDCDELEERLRKLSTKEIEDGADDLLTDVAGLKIN